jgi:multidrug efflux system membrane fusion protein
MNDRSNDPELPADGIAPAPRHPSPAERLREDAQLPPTRPARRGRPWVWIIALLVLIAAGVGAWWWSGGGNNAAPEQAKGKGRGDPGSRPMPVVAMAAHTGNIEVFINALGTVVPRNMLVVRSRVDGQLVSVAFKEGQNVKQGDLLAQIDPRPFEVQLTQANGQMARDQAQLKNAQVDLERYRTLLSQDSISRQQVDTQAALVTQYQGAIEADRGAVESAKLQLTYSRITAPISGRVGLRQVDVGNIVHASDGNGLVTITQVQPVGVIFPVPEDNVPRIVKRMQADPDLPVEAYDRNGQVKLAEGKLITFDNQIDPATGPVKLKAEFANTNNVLFPNQFVNVRMGIETRENVVLVPSAAVQRGAPGTFVFLVNSDHSVTVRPVVVGAVQGENTQVQSGIATGDMVVVDGADRLREGAKVELVDPNAPAQPQGGGRRSGAGGAGGRSAGTGASGGNSGATNAAGAGTSGAGNSASPANTPAGPGNAAGANPPATTNSPVDAAGKGNGTDAGRGSGRGARGNAPAVTGSPQ